MKNALLIAALCLTFFAAGVPVHGTTYATWIMIWHGSDQAWWKADMSPRVQVGDDWKALDWVDKAQVEAHLDGIKKAGVSVVVADLTNGWKWLDNRCKLIQSLCAKKGLTFCVGENSHGNTAQFESHAQDIWNNFAGPMAANHDTYFQYRSKPLIACYGIRSWVKDYQDSTGEFRRKFNLVWSSGEDSDKDKWGWQLEPWVGSIPSKDAMFVSALVASADEVPFYQTVRYNVSGYNLTVPNGSYTVALKFFEPNYDKTGVRVFGAKIQVKQVIETLDIFAKAGKNHALVSLSRILK